MVPAHVDIVSALLVSLNVTSVFGLVVTACLLAAEPANINVVLRRPVIAHLGGVGGLEGAAVDTAGSNYLSVLVSLDALYPIANFSARGIRGGIGRWGRGAGEGGSG